MQSALIVLYDKGDWVQVALIVLYDGSDWVQAAPAGFYDGSGGAEGALAGKSGGGHQVIKAHDGESMGRLLSGGARPTVRLRLQRARSGLWRLRRKRPRRRRSARTYIIQLNRSWHGKLKVYREPRSGRSREGMILFAALWAVSLIV